MNSRLNASALRVGLGEDAHALVSGQSLIIGNVTINSPHGTTAHSDGDVLLHALSDALLSCFALGDIGQYFPPSDPAFKDMDSAVMLEHIRSRILSEVGPFDILNLAAVVILDHPKLGPYREAIQKRLADLLGIDAKRIGLSFKTSEGLAPQHIQARVSVLVYCLAERNTAQLLPDVIH